LQAFFVPEKGRGRNLLAQKEKKETGGEEKKLLPSCIKHHFVYFRLVAWGTGNSRQANVKYQ